jgi:hypothetical protein
VGRPRGVLVSVSVCTDMIAPHVNLQARGPARSGKFYATKKIAHCSLLLSPFTRAKQRER